MTPLLLNVVLVLIMAAVTMLIVVLIRLDTTEEMVLSDLCAVCRQPAWPGWMWIYLTDGRRRLLCSKGCFDALKRIIPNGVLNIK